MTKDEKDFKKIHLYLYIKKGMNKQFDFHLGHGTVCRCSKFDMLTLYKIFFMAKKFGVRLSPIGQLQS